MIDGWDLVSTGWQVLYIKQYLAKQDSQKAVKAPGNTGTQCGHWRAINAIAERVDTDSQKSSYGPCGPEIRS